MRIIKEGVSAEQIYNEFQGEKGIRNGIYCKIINGTYEAINPIPAIIEFDEEDL